MAILLAAPEPAEPSITTQFNVVWEQPLFAPFLLSISELRNRIFSSVLCRWCKRSGCFLWWLMPMQNGHLALAGLGGSSAAFVHFHLSLNMYKQTFLLLFTRARLTCLDCSWLTQRDKDWMQIFENDAAARHQSLLATEQVSEKVV